MRTIEQITNLKKYQSPPVQFVDILDRYTIQKLIDFHNNNEKIEKNTGPVISYVKEGEGIIDDILYILRLKFGDFKVRTAHYFDVSKPHIIHNDDDFKLPNSYKAFTIPLEVRAKTNKAKLVFFDQYYYNGPSKFVNKDNITDTPAYYNQFVTSYEKVSETNNKVLDPKHRKLLSHLKDEWLEGLSVQKYFPWTVGSIIAFDSLQLHCASNFLDTGATSKLGLSIFTTID